ncbi:hypothetical protein HMPREF9595_00891 [Cutibacterium acnes HL005PA2]|nr:hypothetical protein HMPREF9598_00945 [Cutibacterium acnes HL050PA1]EFT31825.1 hypothetical protein HMPREF9595_00891 [Cutibacterium acnes HL005PA2]EFT80222.1 hypothetical protein HMPREF9602_02226 [Cutibacterium acnes HL030PA2]
MVQRDPPGVRGSDRSPCYLAAVTLFPSRWEPWNRFERLAQVHVDILRCHATAV